jgi:hypothetical protein
VPVRGAALTLSRPLSYADLEDTARI